MTAITQKRVRFELDMSEGWSAFIFLALMLTIVSGSIIEAGYDREMTGLVGVTFGALVASLFLAKSHFPGIITHLLSLIFGVTWNAFVISYRLPATFTARDKLLEMGYRIAAWVQETVIGGALGTDSLMFTVVMSVLFWLLTYLAIWFSFRAHSLWVVLLPSSVTLTINLYYGPERIGFFIVPYILLALLFTARYALYTYERTWQAGRVRYSPDIVYTFLRYGSILALIAVVLAWVIPTAASNEDVEIFFSRFNEPWERVKSEWIRLFSTLQSERTTISYNQFGSSLGLGGPVKLGNATVMDVQSVAGRYWRATVYDYYTGDGWISKVTNTAFLEPGEIVEGLPVYEARRTITQTFTIYMPGTTQLYALGQPERFSMVTRVDLIAAPSTEGQPIPEAVAMVNSRYKLRDAESYMAVSTIPSAAEDAMRLAGEDYPEWIDRYLQLPDTVPQRVHDLAREIAQPYDNAYDKATAIQDYLREYTYNQQIAAPPEGVDRVDYFLFEMKEGYCNYYASAMAVMARSVGIPARIAAGYSRGEFDRDAQAYRVREHNSHAWVEVYLPRFGWIEFEPTAGEPVIVRPRVAGGANPSLSDQGEQEEWEDYLNRDQGGSPFDQEQFRKYLEQQRRQEQLRTATRVAMVIAISLIVILIAWWQGRRRMSEERPARTYYERMVRQAGWWGLRMEPAQTPNEYAFQLSTSIGSEEARELVDRITDAYVGERFGKKNPARYQPDFAWRDLRPTLVRWGIGHLWRVLFSKGT